MHRVINLDIESENQDFVENSKTEFRVKLETYDSIHMSEVNTGMAYGKYTVTVVADFNDVEDANNFNDYLRGYLQENKTKIVRGRNRNHNCYHSAGFDRPCPLGDIFEI